MDSVQEPGLAEFQSIEGTDEVDGRIGISVIVLIGPEHRDPDTYRKWYAENRKVFLEMVETLKKDSASVPAVAN
jgi:hypothetical protein